MWPVGYRSSSRLSRRRRSPARSPTIRPPTCAAAMVGSGLILVHVSGTADEAADIAKRLIAGLPEDPERRRPCRRHSRCPARDPGQGQRRHQGQRKHRVAGLAGRAGHRVRRAHRRIPAPHGRHHIDRHHAACARRHDESHRGVDARAHRRNRFRPRIVHRLRPFDGVAIPRRTRQRQRPPRSRSSRRWPPQAARSSSARRRSPWPCCRCWCFPLTSCARSALPQARRSSCRR